MDSAAWAIALSRTTSNAPVTQQLNVSRSDRWLIYRRLQELTISCWCFDDGSLHVEIKNDITLLLIHSVVRQFLASRHELVEWLEQCWQVEV